MKHIPVTHPTGQYLVKVGQGLLHQVAALADIKGPVAVVTDTNVGPLYAAEMPKTAVIVTIPAGEQYKTLATVATIYDQLFAAGLDRTGTLIALGGGVVGDIAGFVAATFMRGIDFVQCPTSLLAMVDAAVGGKTGVDMPQGKNLVGAFKQPTAVLADVATLRTLPSTELSAGFAEVIKHGLINDPDILAAVMRQDWQQPVAEPLLTELVALVAQAIMVKRDVVQADPFEKGMRAHLNLGHTFAHAMERVSDFRIGHGQAVAMGLVAAANLSARLHYCDPMLQSQIERYLQRVGLPVRIPAQLNPQQLYRAMASDKKRVEGKVRFVLMRGINEIFITAAVPETAVLQTIATLQNKGA